MACVASTKCEAQVSGQIHHFPQNHNNSKSWTSFYLSFVYHMFNQSNVMNSNALLEIVCFYFVATKQYWVRSKREKFQTVVTGIECRRRMIHKSLDCNLTYRIAKPTGQYKIQKLETRNRCLTTSMWKINLHKHFAMKLLFSYVDIKQGQVGMCAQIQILVIKWTLHFSTDNFSFCGVLAHLLLYPPSHDFLLLLRCFGSADFYWCKLAFSYTVIGRGYFQSQPLSVCRNYSFELGVRECLLCGRDQFVISYLLTVKKNRNISLRWPLFRPYIYEIFDGPTIQSRKLKVSDYQTRSYQAFLKIFIQRLVAKNSSHDVHYDSIILPVSEEMSVKDNRSIYRLYSLNTSQFIPIVVTLYSPQQLEVLIEVCAVKFTGYSSNKCSFGGIATLEAEGKEIISLCQTDNSPHSPNRHIYSQTSDVLVVLYRYNQLGEIFAQLNFTVTKCNSVHIDPCEKAWDNETFRNSYTFIKFRSCEAHFCFTPKDTRSCFVLQVYSKDIFNRLSCHVTLRDKDVDLLNVSSVSIQIRLSVPSGGINMRISHLNWRSAIYRRLFHPRGKHPEDIFRDPHSSDIWVGFHAYSYADITFEATYGTKEYLLLWLWSQRQYYSFIWFETMWRFSKETPSTTKTHFLGDIHVPSQLLLFHQSFYCNTHFALLLRNLPENLTLLFTFEFVAKPVGRCNVFGWIALTLMLGFNELYEVHFMNNNLEIYLFMRKSENMAYLNWLQPLKHVSFGKKAKPPYAELTIRNRRQINTPSTGVGIKFQECKMTKFNHKTFMCFNLSIVKQLSDQNNSYFLIAKEHKDHACMQRHKRFSWFEAKQLCRDLGGILPTLHGKVDLKNILLMMKMYFTDQPFKSYESPGIFLGLRYNKFMRRVK